MLTQARLLELLHYDPKSGVFTWLVDRNQNVKSGDRAGRENGPESKTRRITIDGNFYVEHKVAWFYVKGHWPDRLLDHKDGDPNNNRMSNLRLATVQQNACNRKIDVRNKSGATGVYLNKKNGKWIAQLQFNGVNRGCGNYDTLEEAIAGRRAAALHFFGEFAGELRE